MEIRNYSHNQTKNDCWLNLSNKGIYLVAHQHRLVLPGTVKTDTEGGLSHHNRKTMTAKYNNSN